MARLIELPDDILLEVARYLPIDASLAFSQSFRAARVLSQTSVLWWHHNITSIASYLDKTRPFEDYTIVELHNAVIKASRTWARFRQPGARKTSSFRAPIEENRYEGFVPPGLPFYFSLGTYGKHRQTHLVCRDLVRAGRVIGSYELPPTGSQRFKTKCLAVHPIDHQTVLVAILSEGPISWYSPILYVIRVCIQASGDDANADFTLVLTFKCPSDWMPDDQSKISVRLPRSFHIDQEVVFWVQDVIDTTKKETFVSPLVTVFKHSEFLEGTEAHMEAHFGRWTCGKAKDLYTIGATRAAGHIIVISDYTHTRTFVASVSTVLCEPFDPAQIHQPVSQRLPCFLPRPRDGIAAGFRVQFDSVVEPISLSGLPFIRSPSSVGYKLQAVIFANAGNASKSSTQLWWYTMYLHIQHISGTPTATLRILEPEKGTLYALYISRYGLIRGLLWCIPLGSESVLFLERKGRSHWPILRSADTELELFDPLSGVACGFTDTLGDEEPIMSVSWFGKR